MSLQQDDDGELRRALRALSREQGSFQQARALEQRLLATLGTEALVAPAGAASVSLGRQWWLLGIGVVLGMSVLIGRPHRAALVHDERASAPRAEPVLAPQAQVAPALVVSSPVALEAVVSIELARPQVTPAKLAPLRTPRSRSAQPGTRRAVTPQALAVPRALEVAVARPEDELSLLQRSRASLRGDAATALQLTEQHARDYPAGLFVQERELLAIQALLKQRRDAEASARAERFVAAYSTSAYAARVREMLHTSARIGATLRPPERDGSTP
jgi:hypothetical protein